METGFGGSAVFGRVGVKYFQDKLNFRRRRSVGVLFGFKGCRLLIYVALLKRPARSARFSCLCGPSSSLCGPTILLKRFYCCAR